MNYTPNHVNTLKTNPKALAHYQYLIKHNVKPADAFKRALRQAK